MNHQELYDSWHQKIASTESTDQGLVHPWHLTVEKLLPDLNGCRVLEIGCGRGDFSIWLSQKYPQADILGVDFSEAAIEVARSRVAATSPDAKVAFMVQDAQDMKLESQSFDYIISCECLEHIPEPQKMAHEIYRVLRPGGRFILTTENYWNGLLLVWMKSWLLKKPFDSGSGVQPHENFFLHWRVKGMLEKQGLNVKHTESNYFQWLVLPRVDPAKLATKDFKSSLLKRIFRPYGRHFAFTGQRPMSS